MKATTATKNRASNVPSRAWLYREKIVKIYGQTLTKLSFLSENNDAK